MTSDRVPTSTDRDHWWLCAAWTSVAASPLILDWVLNRRHDGLTWSESTRDVLDDMPYGEVVFAAGWATFSFWYWAHIQRPQWLQRVALRIGLRYVP